MVNGRILVVEDEHIVAMGIQVMLKSLEYNCDWRSLVWRGRRK